MPSLTQRPCCLPPPLLLATARRLSRCILRHTISASVFALCALALAAEQGLGQAALPDILQAVTFQQRLDSRVPSDLRFRDHRGARVRLSDYLDKQPVLLHLAYYRCPMLCNMTREGLITTLRSMSLEVGRDFKVLTISFDPRETPDLAAAARRTALERYAREGAEAGWEFLTGDESSIRQLCEAVGFRAQWDERSATFAHPAGLIVLTPDGRVSRYLSGVEFAARDLRLALVEASAGRIGNVTDQVMLFCFMYDPERGRYGFAVVSALRVGGVITLGSLLAGVAVMLRRERRSHRQRAQQSLAMADPRGAEEHE